VVGIRSGDQGSKRQAQAHVTRAESMRRRGRRRRGQARRVWFLVDRPRLWVRDRLCRRRRPEIYKNTDFRAGYAWAKVVQVTPELGYFMTPNLSLSLQGRIQYISQPSSNALPGMRRIPGATLYFSNGETVRFYAGPSWAVAWASASSSRASRPRVERRSLTR